MLIYLLGGRRVECWCRFSALYCRFHVLWYARRFFRYALMPPIFSCLWAVAAWWRFASFSFHLLPPSPYAAVLLHIAFFFFFSDEHKESILYITYISPSYAAARQQRASRRKRGDITLFAGKHTFSSLFSRRLRESQPRHAEKEEERHYIIIIFDDEEAELSSPLRCQLRTAHTLRATPRWLLRSAFIFICRCHMAFSQRIAIYESWRRRRARLFVMSCRLRSDGAFWYDTRRCDGFLRCRCKIFSFMRAVMKRYFACAGHWKIFAMMPPRLIFKILFKDMRYFLIFMFLFHVRVREPRALYLAAMPLSPFDTMPYIAAIILLSLLAGDIFTPPLAFAAVAADDDMLSDAVMMMQPCAVIFKDTRYAAAAAAATI